MTPLEALQFLDSILQQASVNRATHAKIVEAVNIITEAIRGPSVDD